MSSCAVNPFDIVFVLLRKVITGRLLDSDIEVFCHLSGGIKGRELCESVRAP